MNKLVIRHGLSQANNRENYGTPAFGNPNASLMDAGVEQARQLQPILAKDFPGDTIVAVSTMRRTWETANFAGFHTLRPYAQLDELTKKLTLEEITYMKATKQIPRIALNAAEALLANPPEEEIWFSHGVLIAAMCRTLGIHQDKDLIPAFCEIRELPL